MSRVFDVDNRERSGLRVQQVLQDRRTDWRNTYAGMRHGESAANVRGVIASSIEADTAELAGLTGSGRKQVREAVESAPLEGDVLVVCSDFIRAHQSASIAAQVLQCPPPIVDARLRERNFGPLDTASAENYAHVWVADARREAVPGVEGVEAVRSRALALVDELETRCSGRTVLLVAHGDTLQILQTAFAGLSAADHRTLPPMSNAEIRFFN